MTHIHVHKMLDGMFSKLFTEELYKVYNLSSHGSLNRSITTVKTPMTLKINKLSYRRQTARCFVSLNSRGHSIWYGIVGFNVPLDTI